MQFISIRAFLAQNDLNYAHIAQLSEMRITYISYRTQKHLRYYPMPPSYDKFYSIRIFRIMYVLKHLYVLVLCTSMIKYA